MQKAPPTPKGFRDILPEVAKKRREVIRKIEDILIGMDFQPLETPTIEFAETLTGKYGDEEHLIYKFKDRGDRELALRYDLTVPLARFIANNQHLLNPMFSRYQIGQVFRGENPQHGRYREFTQFDFDIVGTQQMGTQPISIDALVIAAGILSIKSLGLTDAVMLINDRSLFKDVPVEVIRAIDKIHKIGEDGIKKELKEKGFSENDVENYLLKIKSSKPTADLQEIFSKLENTSYGKQKLKEGVDFVFDPTLARGLDYYTGAIFEMKPSTDPSSLTIGSGGRYDNLIGMFAGKQIPAVGFSFGIDRIVDLL